MVTGFAFCDRGEEKREIKKKFLAEYFAHEADFERIFDYYFSGDPASFAALFYPGREKHGAVGLFFYRHVSDLCDRTDTL